MRITLVSTNDGRGVLAGQFAALCNGLAGRGHEICAVCHADFKDRLAAQVLHRMWNAEGPRWAPWRLLPLWSAIRQTKPEVVHAHGDKAAAMVAQVMRGMKRVAKVASAYTFKRHYRAYRSFDLVLAVGGPLAQAVGHGQTEVVWGGLEVAPASASPVRQWLGTPEGVPVVLASGRLVRTNGFDLLIEAWPGVGDAELWIEGDGPEMPALKAQAQESGLLIAGGYDRGGQVGGVRLLGARADFPELLAACDLVAVAMRGGNFSHVLAAALLAGKPAVSTDHPLAAAFLPAEYAAPASPGEALRDALRCALADVPRVAGAQAEAFARAKKELTVEAMVDKTLAAYERALGIKGIKAQLPVGEAHS